MSQFIDDLTKLWRVRKTVFKMLADRGYHVTQKNLEETKEQFSEQYKEVQEEGGGREKFVALAPGVLLPLPWGAAARDVRMSQFIDDLTKLWRVRKTVFKMLADRGYHVTQKNLEETKEQFSEQYKEVQEEGGGREKFIILVHKANFPDQQLIVFFPEENKRVGVKPIRVLAEKMDEKGIKEAILVVRQPLTPLARTAVQEAMAKMRIEVFAENELIVNITDHELVPKHVVLSEEEKTQLLNRYKLKPTQLPRVQITDPMARYFGMMRDQVVKIIRPSETAGRYVTYGYVSERGPGAGRSRSDIGPLLTA
eukprot:CAMPEP_0115225456 /NCGR_PEP_ID=MMETSP0270-20121206/30116_1 /TAXON_ID=71861 /ORGANISM="Scrippsiella trochoidea, Strain CCMP3099" /LENGTH=309 /DNA_ID=CAMNT_0002639831 /DNA_START=82 /DNA_END=1009 /DNA_ORIENTATION=-